jgi:lipase
MSRSPEEFRVAVNGVELTVFEWPGDGPPVLFCHATGFHAHIWDQVIAHLPERRSIAFDMRGHGRSSKPAPPYVWRNFGADVAALVEPLGLTGAIGVGHSLGGHAVTLASALRPSAFSALVLFDPVIHARNAYRGFWDDASFVRKRRNEWASAQEMFERFQDRPPFDSWNRKVLRDYCDHALRRNGDGYVLACPPEIEGSIYEHNQALESNIYAEIATVKIPVHVIRAGLVESPKPFMGQSLTVRDLARSFERGSDTLLRQYSHLIPMEDPALAAKFVADAMALL